MEEVFKILLILYFDIVFVMYQGVSDDFFGLYQDVLLCFEVEGIDFEGEFGVVVGLVVMGVLLEEVL